MKIKSINITPLRLMLRQPYVWSQGVEDAFTVNLIAVESEDGTVGYGETTTAPDADAQVLILNKLARHFTGRSVFDYARGKDEAYRANFLTFGGNMPRFANQLFSGLEMAVLDLQGKVLGLPVWDILGGARRDDVGYFYFLQGETSSDLAADARAAVDAGERVVYLKVGIGRDYDLAAVKAVREAIGSARLRLDANEAWDPATAIAMIAQLAPYNVEYIEQPTSSTSIGALAQLAQKSPIALGADQSVFTLEEVFRVCSTRAADMIAVGPRELGGLRACITAAEICAAAGLKLCIHSSMTTGITTCAEHHVGRAIANLDDGNQIMWQLLEDNIIQTPGLIPNAGRLALQAGAGLGFVLNMDVVARAAERHLKFAGR
jgi:L-alanine-DL-glutamate epimerase-like enolase superfamily enzyme